MIISQVKLWGVVSGEGWGRDPDGPLDRESSGGRMEGVASLGN